MTGDAQSSEVEDAMAAAVRAARPSAREDATRRLRKKAVMAAVLGPAVEAPRVGRWVIEARVGAGGMGVVFRARDPEDGRLVALKVLGSAAAAERPRFSREALVLRAVMHPHVVRYLDHGVSDGLDYLVMEWLEGEDLAARLARGPLQIDEALRLARLCAHALGAAHQAGITHRDVKPSNVFLVDRTLALPRVIDFGIALSTRLTHPGTRLTATGAVLGSPRYMAPEQLRGEPDARTDVYGLGATLFECLAGRPVFLGEHPAEVLLEVMTDAPPSLTSLRPEVSTAIDELVQRMLAKDLRDRPRDMGVVVAELDRLLEPSEARTPGPPRVQPPHAPAPREGSADETLVGRARELAEILGAIDEAMSEELSLLVVVSGEPGAGKSHLLRAIAAQRARSGGPSPTFVDGLGSLSPDARAELAARLGDARQPGIVIAACDDPTDAEALAAGIDPARVTHVPLGPLRARAAARLAAAWCEDPAVVEDVVRLAAGNAGQIVALCRVAREGLQPGLSEG